MHRQLVQQTGRQAAFAQKIREETPRRWQPVPRHCYLRAAGAGAISDVGCSDGAGNGKNYLAIPVCSPIGSLVGGVNEQTSRTPPKPVVMGRRHRLVVAGAPAAAHAEPMLELSIAAKPPRLQKLGNAGIRVAPMHLEASP